METEIQQLLLSALTNLTKEYQKQSNEQIEREKILINALEKLQADQINLYEAYRSIQKNYIENLSLIKNIDFQIVTLTEQNKKLNEQLMQLTTFLKL